MKPVVVTSGDPLADMLLNLDITQAGLKATPPDSGTVMSPVDGKLQQSYHHWPSSSQ